MFVKLQPFEPEQRKFLRQIGLGVAEARLYAEVGNELPVRVPRVWHSDYDVSDAAFVMVPRTSAWTRTNSADASRLT